MEKRNKVRQKEYSKKHYENNKEHKLKLVRINNKRYKLRNRQYAYNYLKENPCVDCGETNPILLEFDHRDPISKVDSVANLAKSSGSLKRLKDEIAKCDIRCVKCHRLKTARDNNWYEDLV